MNTYKINTETTGLNTDKQVAAMAEMLRGMGYSVEATKNLGYINNGGGVDEPMPFEGGQGLRDWETALEAAVAI